MNQVKLLFLTLCITLVTASCGFHLRGALDIPTNLQSIQLKTETTNEWTRTISSALNSAGVNINDAAEVILTLHKAHESRRVASYNQNAKAAEYQLKSEIIFSVETISGSVLIPKRTLASERIYRYDENQVAAKSEEEALLKNEMQLDLVRQLVQQFRLAAASSDTKKQAFQPPNENDIK